MRNSYTVLCTIEKAAWMQEIFILQQICGGSIGDAANTPTLCMLEEGLYVDCHVALHCVPQSFESIGS